MFDLGRFGSGKVLVVFSCGPGLTGFKLGVLGLIAEALLPSLKALVGVPRLFGRLRLNMRLFVGLVKLAHFLRFA